MKSINLFILLLCIFLHFIADFIIQRELIANIKQKSWWKKNYPDEMYKYDYLFGLFIHSYLWAFITFLPLLLNELNFIKFAIAVAANTIIHGLIDDLKCNKNAINLSQDQLMHILQIILQVLIYVSF